MNRYPLWKNILVLVVLLIGFLYTLPNFFGKSPAVQISPVKATRQVDSDLIEKASLALQKAEIQAKAMVIDQHSLRFRFSRTEDQIRARDILEQALNEDAAYSIALNLLPASPDWLRKINALPMYLGLDLRGGVHFLLQVDMASVMNARLDNFTSQLRTDLREAQIRHAGIRRDRDTLRVLFRDNDTLNQARVLINKNNVVNSASTAEGGNPEFSLEEETNGDNFVLKIKPTEFAIKATQDKVLDQNISTLRNRVNELGVSEPVIQRQGASRVVVQLAGVQDTAKAKDILGRTATLELRMVDEDRSSQGSLLSEAARGNVPIGADYFVDREGYGLLVKNKVELTGDQLTDAQPGFDGQTNEPAVHLTLDAKGSQVFKLLTRENVGRRMAIILFEKGQGEIITAPVIRQEIGGGRVQITGSMSLQEASDVALLLRSGALAAPMEIVEERTIGPSLGADNISKGVNSTLAGFIVLALFIMAYYLLFGIISITALTVNIILLVALLSMLQATLTLPGIAAIALTLGMAIDANVLINERIREELRAGGQPQFAIMTGYEKAWGTILDSNITTLIAGLALLMFGSGPVRGFAVVHVLGILTSIFSAVVVSRAMVNLLYGYRRASKLSIGAIWKPKHSVKGKN